MMALNIAVPLTNVGDLIDSFGLLSPISPLTVDCRGVATAGSHGKKQLVSPVGSESSGVSSLDSEDVKKPSSPPTTPTEEVDEPTASSPLPCSEVNGPESAVSPTEVADSGFVSNRSSVSSMDSISNDSNSSEELAIVEDSSEPESSIPKECKALIGGRDVLNLMDNLISPDYFRVQFAQLPENDNIHFFLDNRSQYHRLGANGHIQEYTMAKCKCCDFQYPVNGASQTSGAPVGQTNWAKTTQQQYQTKLLQQQQQQQPFQWNSFNNYDSIANRNKSGLNVAANAFNRTFGGGSNNSNNNGSQYYRNNMATSLFGRDSNRNTGSGNFVNSSTSMYNNHKSYQQSFVMSNNNNNNSKLNNPYGNYQFQQQQLLSKNQQMRYGGGNGNGSGGFNASAAITAATAMAGQNMLNFNGSGKNNNNNNNMFAYFKAMMN